MKRVALIGDSIRMGYQPFVTELLADIATIEAPKSNGGPSVRVLDNLPQWLGETPPDLLHINCGLHDLKKSDGQTVPNVPIPAYREVLRAIFSHLSETAPSTKVIWASTTPVNQEWHRATKLFDRFEDDVCAYNDVAREVAQEFGIQINDLYEYVQSFGAYTLLATHKPVGDGVHYGEEGYRTIAGRVADVIREALTV